MPTNAAKRHRLTVAGIAGQEIVRIWGSGIIGPALVARFYSEVPWVAVEEIANLTHLHAATVRRKLDDLAGIGRVITSKRGRAKLYMADPVFAERTDEIIKRMFLNANCNEGFH